MIHVKVMLYIMPIDASNNRCAIINDQLTKCQLNVARTMACSTLQQSSRSVAGISGFSGHADNFE